MRAVVHHGGAGTVLAGLTAGKPGFVIPQFFDQPYWGDRVHALGCGPEPVRLRDLDADKLARGLEQLATNADYAENAAQLGERLSSENGAEVAVKRIETLMATS